MQAENETAGARVYTVATHNFLIVYEFDAHWRVVGHRLLGEGHHYGTGLPGAGVFMQKSRDDALTIYRASAPYDRLDTMALHGDNEHIHQIAAANGGVYYANTHRNCVVYQAADGAQQRHHFDGQQHNANHVNSVFVAGNIVYAMLHNKANLSEVAVLRHEPARGFKPLRRVRLPHSGCHNVCVDGQRLYYNASGYGHFVALNLASGRPETELRFKGHTKGLSVTREHIVFGYSDFAVRAARQQSRGHLAVLDRESLGLVATIDLNVAELPQPAGNVNEIRCLSEPDAAHGSAEEILWRTQPRFVARHEALWLRIEALKKLLRKRRRTAAANGTDALPDQTAALSTDRAA